MALSNYVDLQAAVRTELGIDTGGITNAVIVDAIKRAESKVNRRARLREQEQLAYTTYANGTRYIAPPENMIELLNLRAKKATEADSEYEEVKFVAPGRLWEFYDDTTDKLYYTLRDQLEFNREVTEDHTVMMHYIKGWDIASDSTNWLLTNYPDVYLYGALMECEAHVKNDNRIAIWKSLFDEGIAELNLLDERSRDDSELDTSEVTKALHRRYWDILTG